MIRTPPDGDDRHCGVVLLGAGDGTRLGRGPKILIELRGRSLLDWALRSATTSACVREVVVVCPPGLVRPVRERVAAIAAPVRVTVLDGAGSRQASARRGVAALSRELPFVAVAEVARPFAPPGIVDSLVTRLADDGPSAVGAIPSVAPVDTVHEVDADMSITRVVPRERLTLAQTPQVFRAGALRAAYADAVRAGVEGTDDAQVVRRFAAGRIVCIPGSRENYKITDVSDLERAERFGVVGEETG